MTVLFQVYLKLFEAFLPTELFDLKQKEKNKIENVINKLLNNISTDRKRIKSLVGRKNVPTWLRAEKGANSAAS